MPVRVIVTNDIERASFDYKLSPSQKKTLLNLVTSTVSSTLKHELKTSEKITASEEVYINLVGKEVGYVPRSVMRALEKNTTIYADNYDELPPEIKYTAEVVEQPFLPTDFLLRLTPAEKKEKLLKLVRKFGELTVTEFNMFLESRETVENLVRIFTASRLKRSGFKVESFNGKVADLSGVLDYLTKNSFKSILIAGLPGSGKTYIAKYLASRYGVMVSTSSAAFLERSTKPMELKFALDSLRKVGKYGLVINEFDRIQTHPSTAVGRFLEWLESRKDEVGMVIATTAKPNDLAFETIRVGRFDKVILLGLPTYEDRVNFFQLKGLGEYRSLELAADTSGLVYSELDALCSSGSAFKITVGMIKDRVKELKSMHDRLSLLPHYMLFGEIPSLEDFD